MTTPTDDQHAEDQAIVAYLGQLVDDEVNRRGPYHHLVIGPFTAYSVIQALQLVGKQEFCGPESRRVYRDLIEQLRRPFEGTLGAELISLGNIPDDADMDAEDVIAELVERGHVEVVPSAAAEGKMSWQEYAEYLRGILGQMGIAPELCLPGEPAHCGWDAPNHALGYLVQLQAKAENAITHMHHGEPEIQQRAEQLLAHWRTVFAAVPCDHEDHPQT